MIDWLTLQFPAELLTDDVRQAISNKHGMMVCLDADGEVQWMSPTRETVRSDSHQIVVELGSTLRIMGSPARVDTSQPNNVFGSGDPVECAMRMINFASAQYGIQLPRYDEWNCTRIDVTLNYFMGDITNVKQALRHMRGAEGGRYQVRTCAESVYWSTKSSYRSAKAYSKGEHLRYLASRGRINLNPEMSTAADGLLRLELSLKRHYFSKIAKKRWHEMTEQTLLDEHTKYFDPLIGKIEYSDVRSLEESIIQSAIEVGYTEGRGKAAFMSWSVIQSMGFNAFRDRTPRATYFVHKKILLNAGLSWADLSSGQIIPLRKKQLVIGQPVTSWNQLLKAA